MKTLAEITKIIKPDVYYPLTVGSLPLSASSVNSGKNKGKVSTIEAIELQAKYGIHFPSTGETTSANNGSMEAGMLQAFEGIKIIDGEFVAVSDIKLKAETLSGLDIIKEIIEAKANIDRLVHAGDYPDFIALKATLSGPGLLAQQIVDESNHTVQSLMGRFAEGLVEVAYQMYEAGARVIQIDEPLFARGHKYRRETGQALQSLVSQIRLRLPNVLYISLHACKEHSQETLVILEKLDVDLLDLEYKEYPKHFSLITNDWLTNCGKNIGVGVVSGAIPLVETDIEITQQVNQIFESYDPDLVMLKPDCQLRLQGIEAATRKLHQLQYARQQALNLLNSAF